MITLKAEKRTEKNLRILREKKIIPAILYGPKTKNIGIQISVVEFERAHREAGDSSLITLDVEGKDFLVLIRETQFAPVSGNPIHADFYVAPLKEKVEVEVPVILKGESLAVKNLGGTLVKNLSELPIKAFPQSLPKEIVVNIDSLKTFDDRILAKDLKNLGDFEIMKHPNDIIVSISRPETIVEDVIEEKVAEEKEIKEETKETKEKDQEEVKKG